VLSQGIAEFLKDADNGRFSPEPDVVESDSDADS
jgi:predicted transcriptional regulator